MKQIKIAPDILIALFGIIAIILWLCQETLNAFVAQLATLALVTSFVFVAYRVGTWVHALAMLRLDYLERKAEVKAAGRIVQVIGRDQSLIVLDDKQTIVTAPTAQALPAPRQEAALPAPVVVEPYFEKQPLLDYDEIADSLVSATNQTTLFLGTTGTSKTTTAFNVLQAMGKPYRVAFFTLKGDEYCTPLGDEFINLKMYLLNIKNQVEQGTYSNDSLLVLLIDEAKSILDSKDNELIALLKYAIAVLREYNVSVWFLGQGKNVGSFKGMNGDDFLNCNYLLLGYPVIGGYANSVLCDSQNRKQVIEEINNLNQVGYSPVIFGAYNPNQRTKPILSSIPHGSGKIDYQSIAWAEVDLLEDDLIEDYPPTFQHQTNFSLSRSTMTAHDKKVQALLDKWPDGRLPTKEDRTIHKAEIYKFLGLKDNGGNNRTVNAAIDEYNSKFMEIE